MTDHNRKAKSKMINKLIGILIVLHVFIMTGCTDANDEDEPLYIAAASDLYHALTEAGEEFTNETGIPLEFTFGSTGLITQQINEGAPYDLFLAAHESYIDELIEQEAILAGSKHYYAIGRNVLMYEEESLLLESGQEQQYLLSDEVGTIAIANPEHAPYGKAAKETLESWGIWEQIEEKLVYAENIRQAYQYVESGNADVGMVALALVSDTDYEYQLVDEAAHEPIIQALGIPAVSSKQEESKQFIEYLTGKRGQEILVKYGFDLP